MAKFVIEGKVIAEPATQTMKNGKQFARIMVEETKTMRDEIKTSVYEIALFGRAMEDLPRGYSIVGATVAIVGDVDSREYNGKYYTNLSANGVTVISAPLYQKERVDNAEYHDDYRQTAQAEQPKASVPLGFIEDEDLPF